MQAKCLRLMGKKLLVALAMEGKFAGEGLQNIDEDDDMLTSMAKELVEKNGIGESADAIWKHFMKITHCFPRSPKAKLRRPNIGGMASPQASLRQRSTQSVLVFGQRPEESRSARGGAASTGTGLLFNWK